MSDDDAYVPQQGDTLKFERPPSDEGGRSFFRVASYDAQTGMTSFAGLSRAMSAE